MKVTLPRGRDEHRRLRVLVVDDSAVVRQVMLAILSTDREIEVSTAADPLIAFTKISKQPPDVVITDLEMPRMDGLTFLKKIMAERPLPVIVCSGNAEKGNQQAIAALEQGAIEVITKPKIGVKDFLHESAVMLLDTVWGAAQARVRPRETLFFEPRKTADAVLPKVSPPRTFAITDKVIAIGASTGGTEALRFLLGEMPVTCPGIVVVQHMPEGFTRAFAQRLNQECQIEIKEAEDGDAILAGRTLIAPGNRHLLVRRFGATYIVELKDGALVSRHRPSVDVLFRSVATAVGPNALGVIMTGMGDDGAEGLLEMSQAGAHTIAQDEASCVVFGMPREAIRRGAAKSILSLKFIPQAALDRLTQ